jgi:hypothetical protein
MDVVCALSLAPSAHPPPRPISFQTVPAVRARYWQHQRPFQLGPVTSFAVGDQFLIWDFAAVHADHLFCEVRSAFAATLPSKLGDGMFVAPRAAGFAGY